MQIVINISDSFYNKLIDMNSDNDTYSFNESALVASIQNGTPLPKGHGRLKDIDKIIRDGISKGFCEWYDEMKYAPTIIEADKESEGKG